MVAQLALIPYSFKIMSFLNAQPRKSLPLSYAIIVGLGYLHNYVCSTGYSVIAACLSLYNIISNHPVSGSILNNNLALVGSHDLLF